jgi:hypothetical protein
LKVMTSGTSAKASVSAAGMRGGPIQRGAFMTICASTTEHSR